MTGCDNGSSTRIVSVELSSPVEATLRAVTAYDATRQLAARVRGEPLPDATTLESFPAQWKTLSFANALYLRLTPADCELKQLQREIMPKLSVRVISDRMRCLSESSSYRPQLVVAALVRGLDGDIGGQLIDGALRPGERCEGSAETPETPDPAPRAPVGAGLTPRRRGTCPPTQRAAVRRPAVLR